MTLPRRLPISRGDQETVAVLTNAADFAVIYCHESPVHLPSKRSFPTHGTIKISMVSRLIFNYSNT